MQIYELDLELPKRLGVETYSWELPRAYCRTCLGEVAEWCPPLVEAAILSPQDPLLIRSKTSAPKHPLLKRIYQIEKKLDVESSAFYDEVNARLDKERRDRLEREAAADIAGCEPSEEVSRAFEGMELRQKLLGKIPLDEFEQLANDLRETLNLPPERCISPDMRIGVLHAVCSTPNPTDFCFVGEVTHQKTLILRERVVQVLEELGCGGWLVNPIEVRAKPKNAFVPPVLKELWVTGKANLGPENLKWFGFKRQELCNVCGAEKVTYEKYPDRFVFNPNYWDGSGIFNIEERGGIFVTEEVKNAMQAANVTGVKFWRRTPKD